MKKTNISTKRNRLKSPSRREADQLATYKHDRGIELGSTEKQLQHGHVSPKELNPCGVPQESVLGPLLFLIYINDIHKSSDKLNFFLFADDTTILFAHKNLKVLEQVVNSELSKVSEWLIVNKLTLNINKSNFVIFCPSQTKINKEISIKMYDNSANKLCSLDRKDVLKFLGILIDCNLKWKHHIDFISLKISKTIPVFIQSKILPVNMIYFDAIVNFMHDIWKKTSPLAYQSSFH